MALGVTILAVCSNNLSCHRAGKVATASLGSWGQFWRGPKRRGGARPGQRLRDVVSSACAGSEAALQARPDLEVQSWIRRPHVKEFAGQGLFKSRSWCGASSLMSYTGNAGAHHCKFCVHKLSCQVQVHWHIQKLQCTTANNNGARPCSSIATAINSRYNLAVTTAWSKPRAQGLCHECT